MSPTKLFIFSSTNKIFLTNRWLWSCRWSRLKFCTSAQSSNLTFKSNWHSYLYVPTDRNTFRVLKPAIDSAYIRDVASKLLFIRQTMLQRGDFVESQTENNDNNDIEDFDIETMRHALIRFAIDTDRFARLKNKREKVMNKLKQIKTISVTSDRVEVLETKLDTIREELNQVRASVIELEAQVVPFLLRIPAKVCTDSDEHQSSLVIIDEHGGVPVSQTTTTQLPPISHLRLGYINRTLLSSIIGPNAHFLVNDGAQLCHALYDYFIDFFVNQCDFVPINGLDMVKSAVVEAIGACEDVQRDPRMIGAEHDISEESHRLHLTGEASLEALGGWLVKQEKNSLTSGGQYLQFGSQYDESNHRSLAQNLSVRATILESKSTSDTIDRLYKYWWEVITSLGLRCQSIRVANSTHLARNECQRYDILVYLHSTSEFIRVATISDHGHYICQRLGLPQWREKTLTSSQVELFPLIKCTMEHYQDRATGKVNCPGQLKDYLITNNIK